ncbi:MAG: YbhN family protein [Bacilli bacterium]
MRNSKKNIIFFVIATILVFYVILRGEFREILKILSTVNLYWIFTGIIAISISWLFKSLVMHRILNSYKKQSFIKTLKLMLITIFFNGITPFATGGQPFQIYYLTKEKHDIKDSTSSVFQYTIIFQIALVIMSTILMGSNLIFNFINIKSTIFILVICGYIMNFLVLFGLLGIVYSSKIKVFITKHVINFLGFIKLLKNPENAKEKTEGEVEKFELTLKIFLKNKKSFIISVFIMCIGIILEYLVAYFVFLSLEMPATYDFIQIIIGMSYIVVLTAAIPIPGSIGGAEYAFYSSFGSIFGKEGTLTASIVWRFISFYLFLIIGYITLLFYREEK